MDKLSESRLAQMAIARNVDPGFVPKPDKPKRLRNNNEESRMQKAVIRHWANVCGSYRLPEHLLFAIPNGAALGHGKGDWAVTQRAIRGKNLKLEGLRVGCPDLFLAAPRGQCSHITEAGRVWSYKISGLFIEMKAPTGVVSPEQLNYHCDLRAQGYAVEVCWTIDSAIKTITDYLK